MERISKFLKFNKNFRLLKISQLIQINKMNNLEMKLISYAKKKRVKLMSYNKNCRQKLLINRSWKNK